MLGKLLLLALAGSLGTLARYGLAGFVHRFDGASFPWGTLTVNVVGCLLAGLLWALFEGRVQVSAQTRVVVLVGFMGAFTTFSTFALETAELVRAAEWARAVGNVLLQNGLGLTAMMVGMTLGRLI
ncbi:MAG: fluoride efflux transporter CrcB [Candidatus Sumerlaeia bacterium]|nr:fluoride efflux transporter CrcB [Candidatus Sumerlaeia bacterium]